jgi:glycine/D-amino acid oxidase-like deaminating enzyme
VRIDVTLPIPLAHVLLDGAVATIQSSSTHQDYAFVLIGIDRQASLGATFLPDKPRAEQWAGELLERGAKRFPPLKQAVIAPARLCARPRSFDGRPLLGPTGVDGLFVASGHGGRGISTGPASARLVANSILDNSDAGIPPDLRAVRYEAPQTEVR